MNLNYTAALIATSAVGLSACSLYDPEMSADWDEPMPSTPGTLAENDAPVSAALFADPADQEAANLLALERADTIPVLKPKMKHTPAPIIWDIASVPAAIEPDVTTRIPVPEPPAEEPIIEQPPVIVAGSGMPDPGSINGPPSDPEVAEFTTETIVPASNDPFETQMLTLDPVFDSPPSMNYGVKLSEESTPMVRE